MPDLNCTKFEARLLEAVEDRRSLGDAFEEESADWQDLRSQANACPHCRQLWNEFALLDRVLPIWKEHVPKVDLADAVIARWRQEQASGNHQPASPPASPPNSRKSNGGSPLFGIVMVVAACVLASVPFWFSPSTNQEDFGDTVPIAALNPDPPEPVNETPAAEPRRWLPEETGPQVDWQALAQDAGSAYWVLAADTADSLASVTVFVPAKKSSADVPQPVENKPAAGWGVAEIGTGLKPIGQDVSRALGFLFEALPGEQPTL